MTWNFAKASTIYLLDIALVNLIAFLVASICAEKLIRNLTNLCWLTFVAENAVSF